MYYIDTGVISPYTGKKGVDSAIRHKTSLRGKVIPDILESRRAEFLFL